MNSAVLLMAHGTPSSLDEMPEYCAWFVEDGRLHPRSSPRCGTTTKRSADARHSPTSRPRRPRRWAAARRCAGRNRHAQLAAVYQRRARGAVRPRHRTCRRRADGAAVFDAERAGRMWTPRPSRCPQACASRQSRRTITSAAGAGVCRAGSRGVTKRKRARYLYSHSLPVRVIEAGDVYADQVAATSRAVAGLAGVTETISGAAITIMATIVMAIVLESFGFFNWMAEKLAEKAKGSGIRLFWYVNLLCFLMTLFFNNDGSILITTPILVMLLNNMGLKNHQKIPYLLSRSLNCDSFECSNRSK